jgi:hypothetical protein
MYLLVSVRVAGYHLEVASLKSTLRWLMAATINIALSVLGEWEHQKVSLALKMDNPGTPKEHGPENKRGFGES